MAAVLAGTPILFGIVGEIINEKAGHLNLGVEGMMSIGAVAGFVVGYWTDNLFFRSCGSFCSRNAFCSDLCSSYSNFHGRSECYRSYPYCFWNLDLVIL